MTSPMPRNELATALGAPLLPRDQLTSLIGDELEGAVSGATLNPEPMIVFYGPGEGLITGLKKAAENAARSLGMDAQDFAPGQSVADPENTVLVVNVSATSLASRAQFDEYVRSLYQASLQAGGTFLVVEDLNKIPTPAQEAWVEALLQISLVAGRPASFIAPVMDNGNEKNAICDALKALSRVMVMSAPSLVADIEARRVSNEPVATPARPKVA